MNIEGLLIDAGIFNGTDCQSCRCKSVSSLRTSMLRVMGESADILTRNYGGENKEEVLYAADKSARMHGRDDL